jgi:branched-chain amino acid transport system ATP-binding protein
MIRVEHISKHFGGIRAVDDVTLTIEKGSVTGLIGPNGAGKSTLFNLIAGLYRPTSGRIFLDGEEITGEKSHTLFHKGLLRTFQIAHPFPTLTVFENLMVVPGNQIGETLINTWLRRGRIREQERQLQEKAESVIRFLNITHLKNEKAGRLSGGQQKLLELARTMMVDAKVVLLDEVGAGVNRTLLRQIGDAITRLNREQGYTFCMIEHDIDFISRLCDPVIVLTNGELLTQGPPEKIKSDPEVIDAYLGRKNREGESE